MNNGVLNKLLSPVIKSGAYHVMDLFERREFSLHRRLFPSKKDL
jgi:hypothetical protein